MTGIADSPRLVPRTVLPRDRALPLIVAGSLLLHVLVLLPLLRRDKVAPVPIEVPVELVQLPDKTPEKPPAPPAKAAEKAPPKPPAKAAAQTKPVPQTKPAPPTKVAAKPPPPKPEVERPARRAARAPAPRPAPRPPPQPAMRFVPPPAAPPRPGMSVAERMKAMLGPMTAMPAVALPGASADGSESVSYSQLVLSQLAKAKKQGRYRGVPGQAGVAFSLGDNGELVRLELVAPSGDPTLDEEAIAMIRRGAPYPPPPPGGRRDYAITLRFTAI